VWFETEMSASACTIPIHRAHRKEYWAENPVPASGLAELQALPLSWKPFSMKADPETAKPAVRMEGPVCNTKILIPPKNVLQEDWLISI